MLSIDFELGLGPVPWMITKFVDAIFVATAMLTPCSQVARRCNFIVGLNLPFMNRHVLEHATTLVQGNRGIKIEHTPTRCRG